MGKYNFLQWLSFHLPKRLVYFCAIKVLADVSGCDEFKRTAVGNIPFAAGIKAFVKKYGIKE